MGPVPGKPHFFVEAAGVFILPQDKEKDLKIALAAQAAEQGDVPVGCVIVRDGEIVGEGRNRREEKQSTASHAEMEAIAQPMRPWGPGGWIRVSCM